MAHRTKFLIELSAGVLLVAAAHVLSGGRDSDPPEADTATPGNPGRIVYSPLGRAGAPMQQDDVCIDPICSSLNSEMTP